MELLFTGASSRANGRRCVHRVILAVQVVEDVPTVESALHRCYGTTLTVQWDALCRSTEQLLSVCF